MKDLIILAILAVIVGLAVLNIVRAKKRGLKCIGCPYANQKRKDGTGCDRCAVPEKEE